MLWNEGSRSLSSPAPRLADSDYSIDEQIPQVSGPLHAVSRGHNGFRGDLPCQHLVSGVCERALSAVPQTAGLAVQTVFVADAAVVAVIVARPYFLLILNGSTVKVADPVNISRSNSCIPVRHSQTRCEGGRTGGNGWGRGRGRAVAEEVHG